MNCITKSLFTAVAAAALWLPCTVSAQDRDHDRDNRREWARPSRIEPGTVIMVRTHQYINSDRSDGRIYSGNVEQDVFDNIGRLAIPRGAPVEMIVRVEPDKDLNLDLESVTVNGERYAMEATEHIESQKRDGIGANGRTAEHVGGGAALGAIIGAIAGGGKGAAAGAAIGAGVGAGSEIVTRGRDIRVPAESVLTFRLQQPLELGVPDRGYDRDGYHYHDYDRDRDYNR